MSNFCFYIQLPPFVAQWLLKNYGSPVKFPAQSVENATIRRFLRKRPLGVDPDTAAPGLTPICIPDSKQADPQTYNYLFEKGKEGVRECIEDSFRIALWNELNDLSDCGCSVMTAVYEFCQAYGIDIDHADTIKQRYYRMRNSYREKGVNFMRRKRIRSSKK